MTGCVGLDKGWRRAIALGRIISQLNKDGIVMLKDLGSLALVGLALIAAGCKEPPPLSQIEQQIFTRSCNFSSCHSGSGSTISAGLNLESPSFGKLVNVKSGAVAGKMRVVPFDPDQSYLMEKLTQAKPTAGGRMPLASDPLPDEEIEMIREWIAGGALNN